MRWLLLKDLQLLRRSPLVTGAADRLPDRPRRPDRPGDLAAAPRSRGSRSSTRSRPGTASVSAAGGFSQEEARRQLCAKVECVDVSSRAEVEQKVKDGDVLGGLILPADFISKLQAELSTNCDRARDRRRDRQQRRSAEGAGGRRPDQLAAHPGEPAALPEDQRRRGQLREDPRQRRRVHDPLPRPDVHILGLQKPRRSSTPLRRASRRRSAARCAGQRLRPARAAEPALADSLLSSVRQPIAVDKQVIAGSIPPLDTFAVAVAAAITLLFVTVLLVSGSLALEREENTFTRLTRGLVSRTGLLVEKATLGHGRGPDRDPADARGDHPVRVDLLGPDLPDRPGDPAGGGGLVGSRPGDRSSRRGRSAPAPCSPSPWRSRSPSSRWFPPARSARACST